MIRLFKTSKALSVLIVSATLLQAATAAAQFSNVPFPSRGEFERGGGREDERGPGRGDHRQRGPGRGEDRDRDRDRDRGPGRSEIDRQQARQLAKLLYRAILFREGEQTGVQGYADVIEREGLRGLNSVAAAMVNSPEFRRQVERNYRPRDIAQNLYVVLLGRSMDPSGRETYVPLIRQGRAAEAVRGILNSSEFRRRHLL